MGRAYNVERRDPASTEQRPDFVFEFISMLSTSSGKERQELKGALSTTPVTVELIYTSLES